MTTFKLVISDPKEKKAYQVEVDKRSSALVGKRIGDVFDGGIAGLSGYKLQVTGGSDQQGFPMRGDVEGQGRKKILLAFGPGFHPRMKGQRKRKSVRGNTVSPDLAQVNAKITEYGKEPVAKLLGREKKEEKPAEGKGKKGEAPQAKEKPEAAEKPAEGKGKGEKPEEKEGPPKEGKPAEKKEPEKPAAKKGPPKEDGPKGKTEVKQKKG
jgi:small subunit ribosomal protein S6e